MIATWTQNKYGDVIEIDIGLSRSDLVELMAGGLIYSELKGAAVTICATEEVGRKAVDPDSIEAVQAKDAEADL